jgi:hypothetical protein
MKLYVQEETLALQESTSEASLRGGLVEFKQFVLFTNDQPPEKQDSKHLILALAQAWITNK